MTYTFTVNVPYYFAEKIKSNFARITGQEMSEEQFVDSMTGLIQDIGVFIDDEDIDGFLSEYYSDLAE